MLDFLITIYDLFKEVKKVFSSKKKKYKKNKHIQNTNKKSDK